MLKPYVAATTLTALWLASAGLLATAAAASERPKAPVALTAALSQSVFAADVRQTVYLRVGVKGLLTPTSRERAPMNIALVIDRSGSMQGARMTAARDAAMLAIDRLTPRDIVSVISYDDRVEVDVPATKATDPRAMKDKIARITARGSTAIWAGLQKGAEEIRKFKSPTMVSKIILLSDGIANVGPSKPDDFVRLGRDLAREGITVSTVGLGNGYNEDLMAGLARASEGTHKFVAEPADLAQFFAREFDDAQNVVAQDLIINIDLAPGLTPGRGLGRSAEVSGRRMSYRISQIIAETEQTVVASIDVPASFAVGAPEIATVSLSYRAADGTTQDIRTAPLDARFSTNTAEREASIDKTVMRDVTVLLGREANDEAVRLRDAGRVEDSRRKFEENVQALDQRATQYGLTDDRVLRQQRAVSQQGAAAPPASPAASAADWEKKRKIIREGDANQAGSSLRY